MIQVKENPDDTPAVALTVSPTARSASASSLPAPPPSKPKSSKVSRPRSPSSPSPPPLPLPPPKVQTIRLDITLGGPENYQVDISTLAKETGQRAPTPTPTFGVKRKEVSDSEGDEGDEGKPISKKRNVSFCLFSAVIHTYTRFFRRRRISQNTIRTILSSTIPSSPSTNDNSLDRRNNKGFTYPVGKSLSLKTSDSHTHTPLTSYPLLTQTIQNP